MDTSILALVFALGLRHGLDADHLAAIDGFARFRPSRWNGVLFAVGHGGVVTALAAGVRQFLGQVDLSWLSPWLFLLIAIVNLWRLLRPSHTHVRQPGPSWIALGPLTMGVLLAIGFETATQLSALSLAQNVSPLSLGTAFTFGMIITDGMDGVLAARVQRSVGLRAMIASRAIGWVVVAVSLGYALADFARLDVAQLTLPLGALLFAALVGLRVWTMREPGIVPGGVT
jgi:high-affinity nickel-transport protein